MYNLDWFKFKYTHSRHIPLLNVSTSVLKIEYKQSFFIGELFLWL